MARGAGPTRSWAEFANSWEWTRLRPAFPLSPSRNTVGSAACPTASRSTRPTWASLPQKYDDIYRQLNPQHTPDIGFRSKVRADSSQEPVGWVQLFEDGAQATAARPSWLDFPFHPLVDSLGNPLGNQLRAAFHGRFGDIEWLLFPQFTLLLPDQLYRPDGLLLRCSPRPRWALTQLDGGAHRNEKWDRKQDAMVKLPTFRFPSSVILGLNFAREFRAMVENL